MTEENKENKQAETPKVEVRKEEVPKKEETPKAEAPKVEAPKAVPAAKGAEEKKAEEKKKEKSANCAVCNKSIKKKRYYYRNGKYFCTKRCWKTTIKKEEKAADTQIPPDAKDQTASK